MPTRTIDDRKESPKTSAVWIYLFAGIGLFAILGFFAFGVMMIIGTIPSNTVITGTEMQEKDIQLLIDNEIIEYDENIELFYSAGVFSVMEDGNLMTNRRLISYETFEDELYTSSADLKELVNLSIEEQGSYLIDTTIEIQTRDEEVITMYLSTDADGDARFIRRIEEHIAVNIQQEAERSLSTSEITKGL